jgi:hypothetical protein
MALYRKGHYFVEDEMELFHGTNAQFERFSFDHAARPGMSGNGFLGIWLAVKRELAESFGSHCLVVKADIGRVYRMRISELSRLNSDFNRCLPDGELTEEAVREAARQFYTRVRDDVIAQGFDAIEIVEEDERVEIVIGLDPERLSIQ